MTVLSKNSLHELVLICACESEFSGNGYLSGWFDSDTSYKDECQAEELGKYLFEKKIQFDIAFTSYLKRAIKTCHAILEQMNLHWIPVHKSWRLNAQMYGMLEGWDKSKLFYHHGTERIMAWTRKFDTAPPPLTQNSRDHPIFENKYELFAKSIIPDTESLRDVRKRVLPFWCDEIVPAIKEGNRVLIVAHESVLRALMKYLDGTSDNFGNIDLTPSIPLVYEFNEHMRPTRFYYLTKNEQDKQPSNTLGPT
ncbi:unnamed protein product [Rodentolepis nana]|uniref:phosphoglycerate mutase (2,3-diphosphoglycerate-dependent) n=1 Tax=Rodentolepis nana TaxID=102285 RepID=A0A0R3TRM6_RODNA|nr:unnamed protein product [Rodentolepis nana]